ncbi:MAG: UDP-N-acetylmuramoyl-tripeptide--D-alanyl-D-alanine ligase [Bacteroidetes bacterium HGW-Bacteroidetes-17]|jgi:UDP-N-acetylmuramoyl-tripeptide--D-alanyl-D-alanine ligase|nr:MAG: UDP-N-acetylmuramoyl-tripeptide--D-alanyl-D-alanine ligase [Bacteroidetes bacterium HGW-Bacteroidetes-17]
MISSIEELYRYFLKHPQISTDSRAISEGSIFLALKGENFNGNKFALQALNQGCSLAVVDDIKLEDIDRCFFVENVLNTLHALAKLHRKKLNIPIIGITGTNGKTTTKELINAVLSKKFKIYSTKGNLNNHIGVPLSILSINNDVEIAVIEMGANHLGEIENLCKISNPNYGLITNIGIAHLEGFGSFEGVVEAKTELYRHLLDQPKAITFVYHDDALLMNKSESLRRYTYGFTDKANVQFNKTNSDIFAVTNWQIKGKGLTINSKLIGDYNVPNIMAAICIGHFFEVPELFIKEAIEEYEPKNQRSQLLQTTNNRLIVDAYNANPSSMLKAIDNFKMVKADQKILILGDMLELGSRSQSLHQDIVDHISKTGIKNVILIGSQFSLCELKSNWVHYKTTDQALDYLSSNKIKNCTILLKGSRGMRLEKLIETL